ncbi:MAG: 16S rRNA (cytosine(967)-C(5))-methyltransferase RsmB [Chthoniobacterales bacterium]
MITPSDAKRSLRSSSRATTLAILREWQEGRRFADAILHDRLARSSLSATDRAFVTELAYGVLRNLRLLDFWLDLLRSARIEPAARDLLRLGLYQLLIAGTAEYAAVNETVALAPLRVRGLINAVLRSAARREAELVSAARAAPLAVRTSHPDFVVARWSQQFGLESAAALCAWNNQPPPLYVRVNGLKRDQPQLESIDSGCRADERYAGFFKCEELPRNLVESGGIYVQDPSTSLACDLLDPQPNECILDACAAPGGKTALIVERMQNTGRVVAADRDAARLETLRENIARLRVSIAEVCQCDWIAPQSCDDVVRRASFDRILVDAPCSNTGVMRRRVDVRWRLGPDDFERMKAVQLAIMAETIRLLKPLGVLVYSTCSLEPEENEQVVTTSLQRFPSLLLTEQRSLMPFRDMVDGAFAARFLRRD